MAYMAETTGSVINEENLDKAAGSNFQHDGPAPRCNHGV